MRFAAAAGRVATELRSMHFANFRPVATGWQPAMNVYAQRGSVDLCFDLAGVREDEVEIVIECRRVTVRGSRPIPRRESSAPAGAASQILLMEIENGSFVRVVDLPRLIDPCSSVARQDSGFLWLHLSLATTDDES